jgi:hypothetical protein
MLPILADRSVWHALNGPDPNRKLLLALRAYFDESGTHCGSPVCVVAGLVGYTDEWETLWAEWDSVLKREQVGTFHATDCATGWGKKYLGWPAKKRDAFYAELLDIVLARRLRGLVAAVGRRDYAEAFVGLSAECVYPQPYIVGFRRVIDLACEYAIATHPGEKLTLIFESAKGNPRAHELSQFLEKWHDWEHYDLVDGIDWKKKTTIPLQAADAVAYETWRELTRESRFAPRSQFQKLDPILAPIEHCDVGFMKAMARFASDSFFSSSEESPTSEPE